MSKFSDEQIDLMLRSASPRIPDDIRISRSYVYETVSNRVNRGTRIKIILSAVFLTGLSMGAPLLEANDYTPPNEPPRVTYEAPGIKISIKQLYPAQSNDSQPANQGSSDSQPANRGSSDSQPANRGSSDSQPANQTNPSTSNQTQSSN